VHFTLQEHGLLNRQRLFKAPWVAIQAAADLLQGKTQVFQSEDLLQARKIPVAVQAVTGLAIGRG
jgi:hypothetical protein